MSRIAILYPTDLESTVPSGIDSFIRDLIRSAPAGLEYCVVGATTDPVARPKFVPRRIALGAREVIQVPVASSDARGRRARVPLTVRYLAGLARFARAGGLRGYDVLDCHRIEPLLIVRNADASRNLFLHQDMSVLRDAQSDILWSRAPALYEALERRLMRAAQRIYCVRRSAVQRYATLYPTLADRLRFVPTCVDTSIFKPPAGDAAAQRHALRSRLGVPDDARVLVFVGRLDAQKDPTLLLDAFALAREAAPDLHLVIIGDGVLRAEVEARIEQSSLSAAVTLAGVRPAAEIAEILRASDLFVLASAYEGMPIAVLEALASGVPVVATPVGEIPEVVREGEQGCLSAERTPVALADAIARALANVEYMRGERCVSAARRFEPREALADVYRRHRDAPEVAP